MVTNTFGKVAWSGNISGAVKVTVELTVVLVFCRLESAPTAPFTEGSSHFFAAEGVGLGVAVVGSGVVVKVQSKLDETSVAPVTVAVMTSDCLGTRTDCGPVTVTATWFAVLLPPPQPTDAHK